MKAKETIAKIRAVTTAPELNALRTETGNEQDYDS